MAAGATRAQRVQIHVGESDRTGHEASFRAILEFLRREGAAGATVTRGVAGFGAHSRIHQASILDLSADLPIVITWIDRPDQIERLLPGVLQRAGSGIVTVEDVEVLGDAEQHLHHERRDAPPGDATPNPESETA